MRQRAPPGHAAAAALVLSPAENAKVWSEAQNVLETRCVVCHGCYDAPCRSSWGPSTGGARRQQRQGLRQHAPRRRRAHSPRRRRARRGRLLPAFVDAVATLADQAGYEALRQRFGVLRASDRFWTFSDQIQADHRKHDELAGLFDYNRLEGL